jgi:hypothetical protein
MQSQCNNVFAIFAIFAVSTSYIDTTHILHSTRRPLTVIQKQRARPSQTLRQTARGCFAMRAAA